VWGVVVGVLCVCWGCVGVVVLGGGGGGVSVCVPVSTCVCMIARVCV